MCPIVHYRSGDRTRQGISTHIQICDVLQGPNVDGMLTVIQLTLGQTLPFLLIKFFEELPALTSDQSQYRNGAVGRMHGWVANGHGTRGNNTMLQCDWNRVVARRAPFGPVQRLNDVTSKPTQQESQ